MKIDEASKTITLSGSSGDFGEVYSEYHNTVIIMLQKSYPDYIISFT